MSSNIILIFLTINQILLNPSTTALNQIGCLIDDDYCEPYEFCLNDSLLGICVSTETSAKALRSEEQIDLPLIDTPIRIHKYRQESDEDLWDKRDLDSVEQERMLMQDPFSLFINVPKRPTIINYAEKEPLEDYVLAKEYDYDQEPSSIDDLIRLMAGQESESTSDEYNYDYEQPMSVQKRDADLNDMLEEMFYVSKEREPRLIRWLYLNRYSSSDTNGPSDQSDYEPLLINRLKSILKENIIIEQIFNDMTKQEKSNLANLPSSVEFQQSQVSTVKNNNEKEAKLFSADEMDLFSENGQFDIIDTSFIFIQLSRRINESQAEKLVEEIARITWSPAGSLTNVKVDDNLVVFKVEPPNEPNNLLNKIVKNQLKIESNSGVNIVSCGMGKQNHRYVVEGKHLFNINPKSQLFAIVTGVMCAVTAVVLLVLALVFCYKRKEYLTQKLIADVAYSKSPDAEQLVEQETTSSCCSLMSFFKTKTRSTQSNVKDGLPRQDYQELCRQRMQNKNPVCTTMNESASQNSMNSPNLKSESSRSSTSSWSEEPLSSLNIDITTGHVILSYMEQHLNDKNRLNKDWEYLASYTAEPNKTEVATSADNMTKNRYSNILPYDHTRVKLIENKENDDYINASFVIDDDPKHAAYIATQGPLIHTSGDFWQMVWEQKSVVIVSLCRTVEYGSLKCNQYWPSNGYELFDKFEIHLVSEHVWCEDYLVRNFFLKNLDNNQTRTITQFHFLTWPENATPSSIKSLLDFRRKVNKSFKSKSSPLIVHCNDGIGRTGTYILIDMILNKIQRGAKEIDLAATLEFLRDQRPGMVKNKAQFEFSFSIVIEEVQNILKALTQ